MSTPSADRSRDPRRLIAPLTLLAVAFAATAAGLWWRRQAVVEPPPVYLDVPAFRFTRHDGRPFGSADLRGKVWVGDFIFTTCKGICPPMTRRMARLRKEGPAGVRFVTFSVDPETDTPEVLARYAAPFDPRDDWSFLTGERAALHGFARDGVKLDVFETPKGQPAPDGPFMHSGRFFLVDGEARIRGYYDSGDEDDMQRLLDDLRAIAPRGL
jgi:protein SCO1/2